MALVVVHGAGETRDWDNLSAAGSTTSEQTVGRVSSGQSSLRSALSGASQVSAAELASQTNQVRAIIRSELKHANFCLRAAHFVPRENCPDAPVDAPFRDEPIKQRIRQLLADLRTATSLAQFREARSACQAWSYRVLEAQAGEQLPRVDQAVVHELVRRTFWRCYAEALREESLLIRAEQGRLEYPRAGGVDAAAMRPGEPG